MILILTALKSEAMPIVRTLGLKYKNAPFLTYVSDDYALVVSGTGRSKAAVATAWAFGEFKGINGAVNIGICGSLDKSISKGTLCIANIIRAEGTKRVYIPDILYSHSLTECSLTTFDSVVTEHGDEPRSLCDMEVYGFAEASFTFLTNDRIAVLKTVSDNADGEALTTADVSEIMDQNIAGIETFIRNFEEYCKGKSSPEDAVLDNAYQGITQKYRLTESQRHILKKELQNTFVYYGTYPDVKCLPETEGREKKHIAEAFDKLICNLKNNVGCIPYAGALAETTQTAKLFGHVYIEEDIVDTPYVKGILSKLPDTETIAVPDYKSVFSRKKQNINGQIANKSLILARAKGNLVYKGSDYCNAFGFDKFYYCSTVMGCIFNCEYCYLQGLYPSGNVVAFVNTEDFFRELDKLDDGTPALICCSYDSDIIALDKLLGTVGLWLDYAKAKPHLTFEIRTKSADISAFKDVSPIENVIIAYTVSPDSVSEKYEKRASSSKKRLISAAVLSDKGWRVRLSVEPVLVPIEDEKSYIELCNDIIELTNEHRIEDIAVGEFRMNNEYFKIIREQRNKSKLFANPFIIADKEHGVTYGGAREAVKKMSEILRAGTNTKIISFGENK